MTRRRTRGKLTTMEAIFMAISLFALNIYASITNPSILPTPPMGFNNWARFMCDLNETLFTTTADAMVSKGLLAAGYNRVNLDDCWMQYSRAPNGSLQWNTTLFPHGMPWLAEYVKSRGFNFGVYENAGNVTCGGYPGSQGYEEIDAKTFESWGIDYLKLDGCNVKLEENRTMQEQYRYLYGKWHTTLMNLTTPLIFSESWPAYFSGGPDFSNETNKTDWYQVMEDVPLYGELARHSQDIAVYGMYNGSQYWESIMTNYGYEVLLARYQEPGYYNDPDFIIADWPWLTLDEKKSQFALWASFSAPLIISAYIPDLTADEVSYLTNEAVIAVDQDPLALQATLVSQDGNFDVLTKNLANGDRLLTVLNRRNETASTTISTERIGLMGEGPYFAEELWTGTQVSITDAITINLGGHATAIYRFSDLGCIIPTGMIFNTATLRCLTASDKSLQLANCTGTDSQVWQISSGGLINPLSAPTLCVTAVNNGTVLSDCDSGGDDQEWTYRISGNLVNTATGGCLTEVYPRSTVKACGRELDTQVFGLPSGVEVRR